MRTKEDAVSMKPQRAYLDYNASAPLLPSAREAMLAALAIDANPSSVHSEGRSARRLVEEARREVAELAGGEAGNVVFTSGATEAASMLLSPRWRMGRAPMRVSRLYVAASDHPSLLNGGRFPPEAVERLPVDEDGLLDLAAFSEALEHHDKNAGLPLVALHLANNETGVIQPIEGIAALARAAGAILVVDAVQAAGRIPFDLSNGYADFLILSSHKIGGPKGAGAIVSSGSVAMPEPLVTGGGQERGHRAGTENVAAIAGFGSAARQAREKLPEIDRVASLRGEIEAIVRELAPDAVIYGAAAPRLPNTSFFSIPGTKAETMQIAFDLAGVALSAGSACSSGKVGPSHVLKAMGFGDDAAALRVSIGHSTNAGDVALFRAALEAIVARRAARHQAA